MKKIISSLSALALIAAMAAPMASFADEPPTPTKSHPLMTMTENL